MGDTLRVTPLNTFVTPNAGMAIVVSPHMKCPNRD